MLPISQSLIEGNQFPFSLLRCEQDALDKYWEKWWELNGDNGEIVRPHPIVDSDPILRPTAELPFADTVTESALFGEALIGWLRDGSLKTSATYKRQDFQQDVAELISNRNAAVEEEPPVVFFMGGGYGSGKSSIISVLLNWGVPSRLKGLNSLVGVDTCKLAIPEYNCLIGVYDGRASQICQDESRKISDLIFEKQLQKKVSFAWDSSLSNPEAALNKFRRCKEAGYTVVMIGILTDLEIARKRAMKRAFQVLRFPPPKHFDASHIGFRENVEKYWEIVDAGILLDNSGDFEDPKRLREKNMKQFGF